MSATGKKWLCVVTAGLFLLLVDKCHLAGEWVIGGVEAKSFAFPFVFWALAAMLNGRWRISWILVGVASAFHVLVGGWTCLAMLCVYFWSRSSLAASAPLRSQFVPLLIGAGISLLGILPPILAGLSNNLGDAHQANVILVTQRLSHHQLFNDFSTVRVAGFAGLVLIWFVITKLAPQTVQLKAINRFAFVSIVIGFVGIVLSSQVELNSDSKAVDLLIYYWFRLPISLSHWRLLFC